MDTLVIMRYGMLKRQIDQTSASDLAYIAYGVKAIQRVLSALGDPVFVLTPLHITTAKARELLKAIIEHIETYTHLTMVEVIGDKMPCKTLL